MTYSKRAAAWERRMLAWRAEQQARRYKLRRDRVGVSLAIAGMLSLVGGRLLGWW